MSSSSSRRVFLACILLMFALAGFAQQKPVAGGGAASYFESVRKQPLLLDAFLREMPKGADLHVHLSGAIYAESYIAWAAADGLCVDRNKMALVAPPCDENKPKASAALNNSTLYSSLVNAMSMRDQDSARESGRSHFFTAFDKFGSVSKTHTGDMLAEVASRAADQNLLYMELMWTPINAGQLGQKAGWDENLPRFRTKLLASGMADEIKKMRQAIDVAEARERELLRCDTPVAQPGCKVRLRFLYQGYRGMPPEAVFAQLLAGFELATADPRFAGVNLVMEEDGPIAMRDFPLHMRMLSYLHEIYPKVHIALHAGELAPGVVPPEGLRNHIRDSVERGHAERIGHGVDVMHETDADGLLKEMAQRKVLVEICLSSNDMILGIRGAQHPLPVYLKRQVPVTIATDDPGVARSDITREYQWAVESYGLSYAEVKRMVRMSLEHSFLPGASLWADAQAGRKVTACVNTPISAASPQDCQKFLAANERAQMQWKLEEQFAAFEAKYAAGGAPRQ